MGLSSGRFVASPSVDIVRVVSVHGICGCVSIPLLMLLPCTVLDVGVGMVTFPVKKKQQGDINNYYKSWSKSSASSYKIA